MSWEDITTVKSFDDAYGLGERPSGIIDVINKLSKPITARKYVSKKGFDIKDGLNKRGNYSSEILWCVLRPVSSNKNGLENNSDIGGEDLNGKWWLYYNPHHVKHGLGQHLQIASKSNNSTYSGFSDEVEYQNEIYSLVSMKKIECFPLDAFADDGSERYIGKCGIERIGNANHIEDNAFINNPLHYEII